jgi:hypothetical protein
MWARSDGYNSSHVPSAPESDISYVPVRRHCESLIVGLSIMSLHSLFQYSGPCKSIYADAYLVGNSGKTIIPRTLTQFPKAKGSRALDNFQPKESRHGPLGDCCSFSGSAREPGSHRVGDKRRTSRLSRGGVEQSALQIVTGCTPYRLCQAPWTFLRIILVLTDRDGLFMFFQLKYITPNPSTCSSGRQVLA